MKATLCQGKFVFIYVNLCVFILIALVISEIN